MGNIEITSGNAAESQNILSVKDMQNLHKYALEITQGVNHLSSYPADYKDFVIEMSHIHDHVEKGNSLSSREKELLRQEISLFVDSAPELFSATHLSSGHLLSSLADPSKYLRNDTDINRFLTSSIIEKLRNIGILVETKSNAEMADMMKILPQRQVISTHTDDNTIPENIGTQVV